MRILLSSVPFAPSVGGIETVSRVLAEQFVRLGHEVVVATLTRARNSDERPYAVLRAPRARALLREVARADVVLQNNVSLRLGWPLALHVGTPRVVAHHVWIPRAGRGALAGAAKRVALRFAHNIAVSSAIARDLGVPATIVPNPYDAARFRVDPNAVRTRDLVFVGRLVSDKGVPVLLSALGELARRGVRPSLTVIGDGPERPALDALARQVGIADRVRFTGVLAGEALVAELNAHRVLVVPSVWEEPFGVVVLEGLACGLVPVVARSGGLPEAAGRAGIVVPKGDATALADGLARVLHDTGERQRLRDAAAAHLAEHTPDRVARAYLRVLERAAGLRSGDRTTREVQS